MVFENGVKNIQAAAYNGAGTVLRKSILYPQNFLTYETMIYRTRAIISRSLYIFYPIFKDHFFVFKEVF